MTQPNIVFILIDDLGWKDLTCYGNQGGTPGSSVRLGDYKLIEFFEDRRLELYNLREDIGEEHDLSTDEPDRAKHMQPLLAEWRHRVEAKIPQPNPDYVPWR